MWYAAARRVGGGAVLGAKCEGNLTHTSQQQTKLIIVNKLAGRTQPGYYLLFCL